ncbi:MAG: hypothetical protein Q4E33_00075 [Erysipelotrichaceae bacterium]|nr:hypothetical protein [Erysipelotrichaceae bacterium]
MKNILKVVLVSMMCLCLFACSNTVEPEDETISGMSNPMVVYDSLEEINEKVGVKLSIPQDMVTEKESYQIINDEIAEYDFTDEGYQFALRGAKKNDDISGIYINSKMAYDKDDLGFVEDENFKAYRFFVEENQYVLTVKDNGEISEDDFDIICNSIENEIYKNESCEDTIALIGNYQDSYTQRASATIELAGRDKVLLTITWPNSVEEYEEWGAVSSCSSNKIRYDSLVHKVIVTDAEGNSDVSTNIVEEDGFFVIKDGKLYWTGANDETKANCVFEKIEQVVE